MTITNAPGPRPEDRTGVDGEDAVDLLENPAEEGPFAFTTLLASAPRVGAEGVLWFVGVVLVLAGSLYFTQSNWAAWDQATRAMVVSVGLVSYQALFVCLAALVSTRLDRDEETVSRLPVFVLAGIGTALTVVVGWSAAATSTLVAGGVVLVSVVLSWLALKTARSAAVPSTAVAAAGALFALAASRAAPAVTAVLAAVAFAAIAHATWRIVRARRSARIVGLVHVAYLATAVVAGAASHPSIPVAWIVAPALGALAFVVHRGAHLANVRSSVPRIVVIVAALCAMATACGSDLVPVAGRIAMLVAATGATAALFFRARLDDRRLPIALAVVTGLFVYFFVPAPFRAVMDALLAGAKSALGYEDRPLPVAYYGLTFLPYLAAWWLLGPRLGRLYRTVRVVLFVVSLALSGIAFAELSDPRPVLFTLPIYAAAFAFEARRRNNLVAAHAGALFFVLFAARAADAWLGGASWLLGVALAGAALAARRDHGSRRTVTQWVFVVSAVVALTAISMGLANLMLPELAAACVAIAAATLLWLAHRLDTARLGAAAIGLGAVAAHFAFPESPLLVLSTAAVVTTIAGLARTIVERTAAVRENLSLDHRRFAVPSAAARAATEIAPVFASLAILFGVAARASTLALVPAVACALAAPIVTGRRWWILPGALGLAALAGVGGASIGIGASPVVALLAVAFVALARTDDLRPPLLIAAGFSAGFAVVNAAAAGAPVLALHLGAIVVALMLLQPGRGHIAERVVPFVVAAVGIAGGALLADPLLATTPAAFSVLIWVAARTRRGLPAAIGAAIVLLAAATTPLEALAFLSLLGPFAAFAAEPTPRAAPKLFAAGATIVVAALAGASSILEPLRLLWVGTFLIPLVVATRFAHDDFADSLLDASPLLSLAATPVLAAWAFGHPTATAAFVGPALVLITAPFVDRRAPIVLLAGVGAAGLAVLTAANTPLDLRTTFTVLTVGFAVLRRVVDPPHPYLTILTTTFGVVALTALYAEPTAFSGFEVEAYAAWTAVLLMTVFAATGWQATYGAGLVAALTALAPRAISVIDGLAPHGELDRLWLGPLAIALLASVAAVSRRLPNAEVYLRRKPSSRVAVVIATPVYAAVVLANFAVAISERMPTGLVAVGLALSAGLLWRAHRTRFTELLALIAVPIAGARVGADVFGLPGAAIGTAVASLPIGLAFTKRRHRIAVAYTGVVFAICLSRLSTHGFATASVLAVLTTMLAASYHARPRRHLMMLTALAAAATTTWSWFGIGHVFSTGRPELAILPFVASGFLVVAGALTAIGRVWSPADAEDPDAVFFHPIRRARYGLVVGAVGLCLAHVGAMPDPGALEMVFVAVTTITGGIFFARTAQQRGRAQDAVLLEATLVLGWLFLSRQCRLFAGVQHADAWAMMIAAFLFSGVHTIAARGHLSPAFAKTARASALVLPVLSALAFEPDLSWRTAGVTLGVSLAYAVAARVRVSRVATPLATIAVTAATLVAWATAGISDPQLYALPVGAALLFLAHVYRDGLSTTATIWIRIVAMGGVYLASFFSVLAFDAPSHSLVMACIAVGGAVAGVLLRVRSYLFLGAGFLVVDLATAIVRFGLSGQTAATIVLTGLGLALLASLVVWSLNRARIVGVARAFGLELAEWEV